MTNFKLNSYISCCTTSPRHMEIKSRLKYMLLCDRASKVILADYLVDRRDSVHAEEVPSFLPADLG